MTERMRATIGMAAASLLALALAGCGAGIATVTTGTVTPVAAAKTVTGTVFGGQQPISGASIQLYAVGITGVQSTSTLLNTATVTSNQNGNFTFSGSWNCTSNTATYGVNPEIYIVAQGGNPGIPASPGGTALNNAAIILMAAIGPCNTLTPTSYVSIDERTTVAAVYALAPFMADAFHAGAQGAASVGLGNAFNTAAALANSGTGAVPGAALAANGTAPVNELNTLADIIAMCVNSTGTDSLCGNLFSLTTPSGGSAPTNVVSALLHIAKNPGANVASLWKTVSATPVYMPVLSSAPNDWTVALNFTGGGLNAPADIALDASGNAWVANAGGNSITELNGTGTLLTGTNGYTGSNNLYGAQGIAIDRGGNVWVAVTLLSSVVEVSVSGGAIQGNATYTAGGIAGPTGIAIDSRNDVWVSNFAGASVTELNSAGTPLGSSPLTAGGTLQTPLGVAIDYAGTAWITDNSASVVAAYDKNQTLLSGRGYTDNAMVAPVGVALDSSGHAWIAGSGDNGVSLLANNGSPLLATPVTGGGLSMPTTVAIDGAGVVWVANSQTAGSLSELQSISGAPLSPAAGFGVLNTPAGVAIDLSGNVWTANSGDNSVSMFVGLATPIAPLSGNVGP